MPTDINHTPSSGVVNEGEPDMETFSISNPNEVIRINNKPMNESHPDPIGAGKMLWAHPQDKIKAEVYVKYSDFDNTQNNAITGIASYLINSFNAASLTIDGLSIFNALDQAPSGIFSKLGDVNEEFPRAFLTYIVYDRNLKPVAFNQFQVTEAAKVNGPSDHERLAFEITIEKEGYVYVYVSNQTDQNMDVYFDDLKITHEYSAIVAGSDYYPFGLPIEDRQITRHDYRYGYQGQFSEKDSETGWNHFELRDYNPTIGRWNSMDVAKQFWSPYSGMGNNPVNAIDPDGAYTRAGAAWRWTAAFLAGQDPSEIYQAGAGEYDYGFNTDAGGHFGPVGGTHYLRDAWNSNIARSFVSDYYVVDLTVQGAFGGYIGQDVNFTLMLRGKDPGLYVHDTQNVGITLSGGLDVGLSIGDGYFMVLDPSTVSSDILGGPQFTVAGGLEAKIGFGGGYGAALDIGYSETGITTVTKKIYGTVGVGFASPIHVSLGHGWASTPRALFKF